MTGTSWLRVIGVVHLKYIPLMELDWNIINTVSAALSALGSIGTLWLAYLVYRNWRKPETWRMDREIVAKLYELSLRLHQATVPALGLVENADRISPPDFRAKILEGVQLKLQEATQALATEHLRIELLSKHRTDGERAVLALLTVSNAVEVDLSIQLAASQAGQTHAAPDQTKCKSWAANLERALMQVDTWARSAIHGEIASDAEREKYREQIASMRATAALAAFHSFFRRDYPSQGVATAASEDRVDVEVAKR